MVNFTSRHGHRDARLQVTSQSCNASARRGNNLKRSKNFTRKPRPESGLDCLTCSTFARQRTRHMGGAVMQTGSRKCARADAERMWHTSDSHGQFLGLTFTQKPFFFFKQVVPSSLGGGMAAGGSALVQNAASGSGALNFRKTPAPFQDIFL